MSIVGRREKIFHIFDTAPTKGENNRERERDNFIYCTLRERERARYYIPLVGKKRELTGKTALGSTNFGDGHWDDYR